MTLKQWIIDKTIKALALLALSAYFVGLILWGAM